MKRTTEVDLVIGGRIQALRTAAGMSQDALGKAVGISLQQIQKYERGTDRIAVGTLVSLAQAMSIHPGTFFDTPAPTGDAPGIRPVLKAQEGLQRVSDPRIRKRLVALTAVLAGE